ALANALAGTPVTVQGGLDVKTKTLTFDIQVELAKTISTTVNFGSSFADLGLTLNGNVPVQLSVGARLDFSLGLDLSRISAGHLPDQSDFFVQFRQVQVSGDVTLPDI